MAVKVEVCCLWIHIMERYIIKSISRQQITNCSLPHVFPNTFFIRSNFKSVNRELGVRTTTEKYTAKKLSVKKCAIYIFYFILV